MVASGAMPSSNDRPPRRPRSRLAIVPKLLRSAVKIGAIPACALHAEACASPPVVAMMAPPVVAQMVVPPPPVVAVQMQPVVAMMATPPPDAGTSDAGTSDAGASDRPDAGTGRQPAGGGPGPVRVQGVAAQYVPDGVAARYAPRGVAAEYVPPPVVAAQLPPEPVGPKKKAPKKQP